MARLRYNGLRATLGGSGLTATATAITFSAALTYNGGAGTPTAVPTIGLTTSDYIPLSIVDPTTGLVSEIVYLTAYTTGATTGTISRGNEGTTGQVQAVGRQIVHDVSTGDFGVLTSFVTAWTAATTNPSIGNGSSTGGYYLLGPLCFFWIVITSGSTTSYGSGAYSFTLPVASTQQTNVYGEVHLSGGNPYPLIADLQASNSFSPKAWPTAAGNPTVSMTPTVPATLASGATIRFNGVYVWV